MQYFISSQPEVTFIITHINYHLVIDSFFFFFSKMPHKKMLKEKFFFTFNIIFEMIKKCQINLLFRMAKVLDMLTNRAINDLKLNFFSQLPTLVIFFMFSVYLQEIFTSTSEKQVGHEHIVRCGWWWREKIILMRKTLKNSLNLVIFIMFEGKTLENG